MGLRRGLADLCHEASMPDGVFGLHAEGWTMQALGHLARLYHPRLALRTLSYRARLWMQRRAAFRAELPQARGYDAVEQFGGAGRCKSVAGCGGSKESRRSPKLSVVHTQA
jgi:hypothetical protein